MRKERWIWQTGTIIKQKGGIITYTDEGKFTPRDQWGFFIQQDPHTLDAQNEWYYNPKNKRIRLYSTSQPTSVKVASREYATDLIGRSYLIMEGLTLSGTNTIGIGRLYAPAAIFSTAEITSPAPSAMTTTSGQDSPTNIRGPTTTRTWPVGRLSRALTCTHRMLLLPLQMFQISGLNTMLPGCQRGLILVPITRIFTTTTIGFFCSNPTHQLF